MAAKRAQKPAEGTIWRAVYDSGRWDRLERRRKRWNLAWCPDEPAPGVPWRRLPFRTPVPAPWSEASMHAGVAGSRILRYAVWHDGGSAAACTATGYARGTFGEVLGTDAQMCRLGIPAANYGITKERCLARGWGWATWDLEFSQKHIP